MGAVIAMISTWGLHRRFGDTVAVEGLDLEIDEGEVFGVLGPNSAGKTSPGRRKSEQPAPARRLP